jgi:hypothetical protein
VIGAQRTRKLSSAADSDAKPSASILEACVDRCSGRAAPETGNQLPFLIMSMIRRKIPGRRSGGSAATAWGHTSSCSSLASTSPIGIVSGPTRAVFAEQSSVAMTSAGICDPGYLRIRSSTTPSDSHLAELSDQFVSLNDITTSPVDVSRMVGVSIHRDMRASQAETVISYLLEFCTKVLPSSVRRLS